MKHVLPGGTSVQVLADGHVEIWAPEKFAPYEPTSLPMSDAIELALWLIQNEPREHFEARMGNVTVVSEVKWPQAVHRYETATVAPGLSSLPQGFEIVGGSWEAPKGDCSKCGNNGYLKDGICIECAADKGVCTSCNEQRLGVRGGVCGQCAIQAALSRPRPSFAPQSMMMPWEDAEQLMSDEQRAVLLPDHEYLQSQGIAHAVQTSGGVVEVVALEVDDDDEDGDDG